MSTKVTYSKNVILTIANRSAEGVLALIMTSLIIRILGQEDMGIFYMISSVFMMFAVFSEFGSRLIIVREISKNKDKAPLLLSSALLMRGALTFISLFCLLFFVNLKWDSDYALYGSYIYVFWLIPFSISEVLHAVFTGFERNEYSVAASLPSKLIGCLMSIGVILVGRNLIPVFAVLTLSAIIRPLISFYLLRKKLFIPKLIINIENIVFLFKESFPLAIMNGIPQLYDKAGMIILSFTWGDRETGLLGIIATVNRIFSNLAVNLMMPLLPVLSRLKEEDFQKFQNTYRRFLKYLFGLTLPMGFGISVLASDIILILFGENYLKTEPGLQIIVWSGVIFPFINFFSYINTSVGDQWLNAKFSLINLAVILLLCTLFIPTHGFLGVCIANTCASALLVFIFYRSLIKRSIVSFKFIDIPLKQIIASVCMYFVISYLSGLTTNKNIMFLFSKIIWLSVSGAFVYFTILFFTGCIDDYDRKSIKEIIVGIKEFCMLKISKITLH